MPPLGESRRNSKFSSGLVDKAYLVASGEDRSYWWGFDEGSIS